MTLTSFLGLAVAFIAVLLVFCIIERTRLFPDVKELLNRPLRNNDKMGFIVRSIYFVLFAFLVSASISMAKLYMFPPEKNKDNGKPYFSNVRYHVLAHDGYILGQRFYLSHGMTLQSEGFPQEALWDSKDGEVLLDRNDSSITINQFTEPVFVCKTELANNFQKIKPKKFRKTKKTYHLVNQVLSDDVSNGFALYDGERIIYRMDIEQLKDECLYISVLYITPDSCLRDTSTFDRTIKEGYPLLDIIAKSPRIDVTETLERAFSGSYLVRQSIPMNGNIVGFDKRHPAPLVLMPGLGFYLQNDLNINQSTCQFDTIFRVPFQQYAWNDKLTFYAGVGKHQTEKFGLTYPDSTHMQLNFLLADMHQLREMDGRVFITSSVDAIADDAREGGFLFNKFMWDDNFNHINANIRYKVGSARDSLRFSVLDLNDQLTGDRHDFHSDERFTLKTSNRTSNAIEWIFEIVNMRETNDLQMRQFVIFALLMLLSVLIRLGVDAWFNLRSLSLFELGVYVVFFSLAMVRLLLGWRMSTFPPIENIQLPIYDKMRESIFDWPFKLVWLLPIIVTLYTCIDEMGKRKFWWKRFEEWCETKWKNLVNKFTGWGSALQISFDEFDVITILFMVLLLVFAVVGKTSDSLSRLCNIVLPLFLYLIAEIWMEYRLQKLNVSGEKAILTNRIVHYGLILGYLFLADAGFTIVFVAFILLFEGGLRGLFSGERQLRNWKKWKRYVISVVSFVSLYLILHWEGDIMISIFRYTGWYVAAFGFIVAALLLRTQSPKAIAWTAFFITMGIAFTSWYGLAFVIIVVALLLKTKPHISRFRVLKWTIVGIMIAVAILGVVEATCSKVHICQDIVNSKAHMRYRAEIQQLDKDEKIDDIIAKSNFASNDIVFIMRSAHNQWFINQYIKAGKELEKSGQSFAIQPHSNQGSPYPTQTTDLVVTRYILAEHGEMAAKRILMLWVLLTILFILEVEMCSRMNIKCVGPLLMVFSISLMVYLSATNRVVFIGQDFPMISIQSKIAFLLPWLLLMIPLIRSVYLRQNNVYDNDDAETDMKGIVFAVFIAVFTTLCFHTIEQKGKDQHESQFNVSTLIQSMSDAVAQINEQFVAFQHNKKSELKKMRILSVWNAYRQNGEYSKIYDEMCDSTTCSQFVASALSYFDKNQLNKTDVNQLLHLRRRGGMCYLAINKRHYFIPAIMQEEEQWTGDLFAAYLDPNLTIFGLNNTSKIKLNENVDYETNILQNSISQDIPNLPLMRFDSDWVPGDRPLLLLSSEQSNKESEYFCIELDTLEIKSGGRVNQPATAVMPGDVFSLNKVADINEGKARTVFSAQLREEGTNYIARNIWLNGHRRLFYPLGKESMWSYHYANLVSTALGDSSQTNYQTAYKDTSLHLSIDYNLTKTVYKHIQNEMSAHASMVSLPGSIRQLLENFRDDTPANQRDSLHNHTDRPIYYDEARNRVVIKNRKTASRSLVNTVAKINNSLKEKSYSENRLSDAINKQLQRPYDFTCVAMDGEGHIRLLFDYTQRERIDPNNIQSLSKLVSDLYIDGSAADERDLFGCKALQYIPMGPGSSFKPIAYTAITSKEKLDWEHLTVTQSGIEQAKSTDKVKGANKTTTKFDYYGGIDIKKDAHEKPLSLDLEHAYDAKNYLIRSDNLYHSVVIMLGLQSIDQAKAVLTTPPSDPKMAFPVISINGQRKSFDPQVWWRNGNIYQKNSLLESGLNDNFCLASGATRTSKEPCANYYGADSVSQYIYHYPTSSRGWSYAERGTQNTPDRKQKPVLKNGFNQMVLGAFPLQITALQMAISASRLVQLNSAEQISTLMDGEIIISPYKPFDLGSGWTEESYMQFVRDVVWMQLGKVATIGTANSRYGGLANFSNSLRQGKYGKPYFLYCKTGTLDDERSDRDVNRIKHLMVIVTDRELEKVRDMNDLKQVRYYTIYISYMGIESTAFTPLRFQKYIEDVVNSATFKSYMNPKNI